MIASAALHPFSSVIRAFSWRTQGSGDAEKLKSSGNVDAVERDTNASRNFLKWIRQDKGVMEVATPSIGGVLLQ
jgi:hypothetical protein